MDLFHIVSMGVAIAIIGVVVGRIQGRIFDDQFKSLIDNHKNEHIVIRLPRVYKWIGIIGSIGTVGLFLVSGYFDDSPTELWVVIGFGVFVSLGVYLVIAQSIWRIDIQRNEEFFIYITSFSTKHKIFYRDISFFVDGVNYVKLKMPHKTYWIDNKAINIDFLTLMFHEHKVKKISK